MIRGSLISALMLALTMALVGGACSDDTEPPVDNGLPDAPDGSVVDFRTEGITTPDGQKDGLVTDGPLLPDKGPPKDGCGQCQLSIYSINGATTLPTQLSSLDDKDANTAGIQIAVTVNATCVADGADVELAVTGLTPAPKVKIVGGFAVFQGVTVSPTVGVATLAPRGTGCESVPHSINVVRDPTCTFTAPVDGQTLTAKDDTIPNNGTFEYTIKFATQYATGGTVTANIVNGASLGSAPVSAGTGIAQFENQILADGDVELQGSVEITLAGGQKITKTCLATGKTTLAFKVDTAAPACTIAGFTPAAITTPNGLGLGPLQDADGNTADLQTTVTVNTDNGKNIDVTLTVGGQTYGPKSTSTGSVTFAITVADGAPSFRATCVNTTTTNQGQSGVTKVIVDTAAPLAVTDFACFVDLAASNHRKGILTCDWTSADDGATGSGVASYDVNCDKNAVLTVGGFDTTAPIKNPGLLPTPTPKQTLGISGLAIPNGYSCAVQAVDALGNKSAVSNITGLVPFAFQVTEIQGTAPGSLFGYPIVAGDFNCDGLSDIAVGAYQANGNMGEVLIYFSTGASFATTPQKISGTRTDGRFGVHMRALDYDGRTFSVGGVQRKCSDLAVASYSPGKQTARIYLYLGRPAFGARTDEGVGTGAEQIYSAGPTDTFAPVLGSADLDGDGLGDIATTHKTAAETNLHLVVHYGKSTLPMMTITGSPVQVTLPSDADVDLEGNAASQFGVPLTNAGKLGATSAETLIVGSSAETNAGGGVGRAYLFLGQARASGKEVATLASARIVRIDGDANSKIFGRVSAGVGDLNKDGVNEFAISDAWATNGTATRAGAIYIFDLKPNSNTMDLTDAKAIYTHPLADNTDDWFGRSIANVPAGAGSADLTGDGIDDLVTGTYHFGAGDAATAFIFNGASGALQSRSTASPDVSFSGPSGTTTSSFGLNLVLLIDANGDGFGDILIGEAGFSSSTGRVVVYY